MYAAEADVYPIYHTIHRQQQTAKYAAEKEFPAQENI